MKKIHIPFLALIALSAKAFVVDWDRITHWAGSGPNKAALVVQFNDEGPEEAYVWGYRWEDGAEPSGEDMFRSIAEVSTDLTLFTQYTGWMGNTVCGIGYSDGHTISSFLEFDFNSALEDAYISFNWFSANTSLGQTSVPGWDTQELCDAAIEASALTHILDHPINAREYGYACYDYDWWQPYRRTDAARQRWNAGWYKGYWSYWVGGTDSDDLSYSGVGMTSRKLHDGCVDAWKYMFLDGPVVFSPRREGQNRPRHTAGDADAHTGASPQWHDLNYDHFGVPQSGVEPLSATNNSTVRIYDMQGNLLLTADHETTISDLKRKLRIGIYIIKCGRHTKKLILNGHSE